MARYVDGFVLPVPKKNVKAGLVDPPQGGAELAGQRVERQGELWAGVSHAF